MSNLSTNRKVLGFIDAWGGGAACAALTLLRRCWPFGGPDEAGRKGLLFLKLAEQGSTVLASQAIRDAAERHGAENLYFLVFEENRFILDALEIIPPENVLAIRTKGAASMALSGLGQLFRIRRLRLLACVDLEFFARSTAVIGFLTGIPRRVGFHGWHSEGPFRGNLFTHRLRYNPHVHTSVIFRSLVAAVDADAQALPRFDWVAAEEPITPPAFRATEAEIAKIRGLIKQAAGGTPGSLVLLNANASDLLPLRKWANENYVELARRILDEVPDAWIAFTGGPGEREKIDALAATVGRERVFSMAGRTSLRELLALYAQSDVLVTNDSGPAHFAALTPVDTVVLFGPETPKLFATLSARNQSLTANLACSPCVSALNNRQTDCTNNVCMQRITVAQVFAAVRNALEHRAKVN
ncbi:MAG TPA: glycosyltransferase family 9 protein [Chthoniobacterales bacterium]